MDPARDDRGEGRRRLRAAWFTYVRAPLEEFRWIIIAFLALITVALGYWGFQRYQFASSQNFLDRLYLTLRLFRSGVTVDPPLPIQLEIARWLAWVVLIATTVGALLSVLRDRFDLVRVRFARNHVLICGLGRCGRRLAVGFRRRGYPVVVIESDPSSPGVEAARREGIIVIAGDATEPSMLLRAGLGRARRLIATCGDDGRNVAVITTAHEQMDRRTQLAARLLRPGGRPRCSSVPDRARHPHAQSLHVPIEPVRRLGAGRARPLGPPPALR